MKLIFKTDNQLLIDEVNNFVNEWPEKESFSISTSGSTGVPKIISHSKKVMIASAQMTGNFFHLRSGQSAFLCLSPSTIGGKMMMVRALTLDLSITIGNVSSQPFTEKQPTYDFVAMVPMQVESALNEGIDLSKIGNIIIGGAPISSCLEKRIISSGMTAYQTFGMTETVSHIALRKITDTEENYQTLSGVSISSSDDKLIIDAPALGVHQLTTNDIVSIKSPTSFKWLGRADRTINSGGIKLHPEQIEDKLSSIILLPYFILGMPDALLGNKLCLAIEGSIDVTKEKLAASLSKYEIPKEIYFFEKFHYTASGKLDRIKTLTEVTNAQKQVL